MVGLKFASVFLSGDLERWVEVWEKRATTVAGLTSICVRDKDKKCVFSLAMQNGEITLS